MHCDVGIERVKTWRSGCPLSRLALTAVIIVIAGTFESPVTITVPTAMAIILAMATGIAFARPIRFAIAG